MNESNEPGRERRERNEEATSEERRVYESEHRQSGIITPIASR